jgi:hypothetical protein
MNPLGAFAGMSAAALAQALASAQSALVDLVSGNKTASVTAGHGDGAVVVTYSRTTEGALRQMITELQRATGMDSARRRPVWVGF